MCEQLHQAAGDTSFDDCLNLFVGTIGEIRDGPAGIDEDFVVERVDEFSKDREGG